MPVGKMIFAAHFLEELTPETRELIDRFLGQGTLLGTEHVSRITGPTSTEVQHVEYTLEHPDFQTEYGEGASYVLQFGKVWDGWNHHATITSLSVWTLDYRIRRVRDYTPQPTGDTV